MSLYWCVMLLFSLVLNDVIAIPSDTEENLMRDIIQRALSLTNNNQSHHESDKLKVIDQNAEKRSHFGGSHEESRIIQGHCDINSKCDPGQYCDGMYCYNCRKEGEHCELAGECCPGSECQFGHCTKGIAAGDPGTFCDKREDCRGGDICCIHEISISHEHSICKLMLNEHESCGPINLFHQDVLKAHIEPVCGPCKPGLSCKGIGIHGRHSICLPDNED